MFKSSILGRSELYWRQFDRSSRVRWMQGNRARRRMRASRWP